MPISDVIIVCVKQLPSIFLRISVTKIEIVKQGLKFPKLSLRWLVELKRMLFWSPKVLTVKALKAGISSADTLLLVLLLFLFIYPRESVVQIPRVKSLYQKQLD